MRAAVKMFLTLLLDGFYWAQRSLFLAFAQFFHKRRTSNILTDYRGTQESSLVSGAKAILSFLVPFPLKYIVAVSPSSSTTVPNPKTWCFTPSPSDSSGT